MILIPDTVTFNEEDGIETLAFGNTKANPFQYFIVSLEQSTSKQDLDLGLFGYHSELNDQSSGVYNGISEVSYKDQFLTFVFNTKASQVLGTLTLSIDLSQHLEMLKAIEVFLNELWTERR